MRNRTFCRLRYRVSYRILYRLRYESSDKIRWRVSHDILYKASYILRIKCPSKVTEGRTIGCAKWCPTGISVIGCNIGRPIGYAK